jgi:hypothetical protein
MHASIRLFDATMKEHLPWKAILCLEIGVCRTLTTHRWGIEEWHRVLKEGCRLESAQLDDAQDIKRLAAIQGPIAADLLSLRDLADHDAQADNPHALKALVSPAMLAVVAMLLGKRVEQITPGNSGKNWLPRVATWPAKTIPAPAGKSSGAAGKPWPSWHRDSNWQERSRCVEG